VLAQIFCRIKLKVTGIATEFSCAARCCISVQTVFVAIDIKRIIDDYVINCINVVGFNEQDIGAVVVNIMVEL
jgi:hypothetical protein